MSQAQNMKALARANTLRWDRARQRKALQGKSDRELARTIIDPPEALASYTLRELFTVNSAASGPTLIPGLGQHRLALAFDQLAEEYPRCRQNWHGELRLRELAENERHRLIRVLLASTSRRAAA